MVRELHISKLHLFLLSMEQLCTGTQVKPYSIFFKYLHLNKRGISNFIPVNIRLCKWLKQLDSKLSPVKGFMGSNPLSMKFMVIYSHVPVKS